ncbi:DNA-binding protein [Streptomyces sp. NBC_01525]|nr:PPC domain-containing DNA-binding protein [Streptomyces benahoarensis]
MHIRLLHDDAMAPRQFAVVLEAGDEVVPALEKFAAEQQVTAGSLTGIGAFGSAALSLFDPVAKAHVPIPVTEHTEVLGLTGNIALKDGRPHVHAHVVLGRRDGTTVGGHLQQAVAHPALEVFVTAYPTALTRRLDTTLGLPVIAPDTAG